MTQDAYEGFAERYDLFFDQFDQFDEDTERFFRKLFQDHQVRSVLDCACGTGRHLSLFHSLGCEVTGSDVSESMLAQARLNLAERDMDLPLYHLDFRELPQRIEQRFDAVACLSSSLFHMPDEQEVLLALRSIRAVLRDGGLLVLSQGTTDRQWAEKPRFIVSGAGEKSTRLFVIDYLDRGARYNVLDITHDGETRELKVWSLTYPCIYLKDAQQRLLLRAGFENLTFFGSYDLEPYDKATSSRLITVATK